MIVVTVFMTILSVRQFFPGHYTFDVYKMNITSNKYEIVNELTNINVNQDGNFDFNEYGIRKPEELQQQGQFARTQLSEDTYASPKIYNDFQNPFVVWTIIVLFFIFCAITIFGIVIMKFNIKKIGFYMFHAGFVLLLAGSLLYHFTGIKRLETYTIGVADAYRAQLDSVLKSSAFQEEDFFANFDSFEVVVNDFKIEKYDVVYNVSKVKYNYLYDADHDHDAEDDHSHDPELEIEQRLLSDIENVNGYYDFKEYGKKSQQELIQNNEAVSMFLDSDNTVIAHPQKQMDKYYEAELLIYPEGKDVITEKLAVNHTRRINGWKIYLMSYAPAGSENPETITMLFKYDPGEYITLVGIWLTMIGAFAICFKKPIGDLLDKIQSKNGNTPQRKGGKNK